MANPIDELYLYMNGIQVGILQQLPNELKFTYANDWLLDENARPISLSMPLRESAFGGDVVYNYFDNLLPDNVLIRKRIQARFKTKTNECFELLSHIGADCVGALQFLKKPEINYLQKIQANKIDNKSIAELLKNYQSAPLGMDVNSQFRISIAGAQEKTALLQNKNQWYLPEKSTPTTHIIKLPIGYLKHANIDLSESVENEWLCLKILAEYDLPVNEASIEYFDDVKTLVVKRFDRIWTSDKKWILRLPQEDFCQVLGVPSSLKYESDGGPGIVEIMKVLEGSNNALVDRQQFMKSAFLFWVLGAIDGHAKNFSVAIEAGGRYRLTPLYDVISAYPIAAKHQLEWKRLKMGMAVKGKSKHYHWSTIQLRHWLAMADRCKFSQENMQTIMDEIFDKMDDVIDKVSQLMLPNFPAFIADPIFQEMKRLKKRVKNK